MEAKNYKDTLLRGIALLGLILILVLGAWGIIVLAFNVPNLLSSAGATIGNMFSWSGGDNTVEVPVVSTTTPATPAAPSKPSTTAPKPTYTYTPAATPVVQLYGLPDLAVRIISIMPQGSRYSMQFEVANNGTNVAATGWMFTAQLPMQPTYTFTSAPQQALRPGDKIVYTMGFDMPYNYGNDYRYDDCDRWDDNDDEWYDYNCDYSYPYDYNYDSNRVVTVTVNPFGSLYEINRGNNTASQSLNYGYPTQTYPYYPQYPYPYSY